MDKIYEFTAIDLAVVACLAICAIAVAFLLGGNTVMSKSIETVNIAAEMSRKATELSRKCDKPDMPLFTPKHKKGKTT